MEINYLEKKEGEMVDVLTSLNSPNNSRIKVEYMSRNSIPRSIPIENIEECLTSLNDKKYMAKVEVYQGAKPVVYINISE